MRRLSAAVLVLALAAALAGPHATPAAAQAGPETDAELTLLYRLALSAEMCGFPVSSRQSAAIGKAMDKRVAALKMSDEQSDAAYQAIEAAMQAESWDRLCAADGEWAKTYRQALARFGR